MREFLRAKDTWRNIRAALETIKVVEYERNGVRVKQTSEVRAEAAEVLKKLGVAMPPKLHQIRATDGRAPSS